MIHRILIFDRKFNCRLDRRYPLNINEDSKNIPSSKIFPVPSMKIAQSASIEEAAKDNRTILSANRDSQGNNSGSNDEINKIWKVLNIKKTQFYEEAMRSASNSTGSLVSAINQLDIEERDRSQTSKEKESPIEHSQQLIMGLTYSMKNMLMKLAPVPNPILTNNVITNTVHNNVTLAATEGYSFSYKTSKYRLFYFESFTGWRFVLISDNFSTSTSTNNLTYGTITPETTLKVFYTSVFVDYLVKYPLGTIYTSEKSTQKYQVLVENDFLHRKGFLCKLDEFIQICDRIF